MLLLVILSIIMVLYPREGVDVTKQIKDDEVLYQLHCFLNNRFKDFEIYLNFGYFYKIAVKEHYWAQLREKCMFRKILSPELRSQKW